MGTRRDNERATLLPAVPARVNGMQSSLINASMTGVRLAHATVFVNRRPCAITLEWRGQTVRFLADPRWTKPIDNGYESGFQITKIDGGSIEALRALIDMVLPTMPRYDRHELIHGVWISTPTTDPTQPASGFTIPMTESQHAIDLFRAAFSRGNRELRDRVRKMAELSITHPEQRYDPKS